MPEPENRVLILFAHPSRERSEVKMPEVCLELIAGCVARRWRKA